jgi:two-component system phosphate regulon response regulator OmpR
MAARPRRAGRRRAASAAGRRRPPHPRSVVALPVGEGYRVTTAMSASDARAKLLGLHFDLLILDVMMPGETGFDLARFIRTSSSVPIIMLTARHEAEAASRACRSAPTIMSPSRSSRANWCCGSAISSSAPRRRRCPGAGADRVRPYVYHLDRGELRQGEEIIHLTDREREMLRILAARRARPCRAWR